MTHYVLGFAFSKECNSVLLIKKQKPDWQKGKLNGIGGKIEKDELPIEAMVREFYEETGLVIPESDWREFAIMQGPGWSCNCFKTDSDKIHSYRQTTEEEPVIVQVGFLRHYELISNVPWLVNMALDSCSVSSDNEFKAVINYV